MRFYGFGNFYLSSLQQGLQAAHVISDLAAQYNTIINTNVYGDSIPLEVDKAKMFFDWANNHKTIILLNGGNHDSLCELTVFLEEGYNNGENTYPYSYFNEDGQSLNFARTSVGIILPEKIYETAAGDRIHGRITTSGRNLLHSNREVLNDWEEELVIRLNNCHLAI